MIPSEAAIEREIAETGYDRMQAINSIRNRERALREVRRYGRMNRERIEADWNAHTPPPRTIAGHIAEVKARVGETRWAEMMGEQS